MHVGDDSYEETLTPVLGARGWTALPSAFGGAGADAMLAMDAGVAQELGEILKPPWNP